jgi:hypothetical protein
MPKVFENGLPAERPCGLLGATGELSAPTPSDAAFDSIPDVIKAFGMSPATSLNLVRPDPSVPFLC